MCLPRSFDFFSIICTGIVYTVDRDQTRENYRYCVDELPYTEMVKVGTIRLTSGGRLYFQNNSSLKKHATLERICLWKKKPIKVKKKGFDIEI